MSSKYFNFIIAYILTTSCILIVSGLNFEGVGSNDGLKKGKKPQVENGSSSSTTETFAQIPTNDPYRTTAETALNHTLDNICRNLRIGDLMAVGKVCRSWNVIASREISRRGLERALLPHIFSRELTDLNSDFHVYHVLNAKPYVGLLFVGPNEYQRHCPNLENSLEIHIILAYRKYFPQYLVTVGVDISMMDENIINSCPGPLGPANGIQGIFVPLYKDLEVKVATASCYYIENCPIVAGQVMDDLMPNVRREKTVIVMFASTDMGHYIANDVLDLIKTRFPQKSYTLWGGLFNDRLRAINAQSRDRINKKKTSVFALSLSGSKLESWSTVVDCRLKREAFDQELLKFKKSIKLKSNSLGLVCGPRFVEDFDRPGRRGMYLSYYELMEAVRKVFPETSFTSVFNYGNYSHYGVNSTSDDADQKLAHPMAISLLILTHEE